MEEENKKSRINQYLDNVDDKIEAKGKKTLWQMVKFIVVSLLVTIIHIVEWNNQIWFNTTIIRDVVFTIFKH